MRITDDGLTIRLTPAEARVLRFMLNEDQILDNIGDSFTEAEGAIAEDIFRQLTWTEDDYTQWKANNRD